MFDIYASGAVNQILKVILAPEPKKRPAHHSCGVMPPGWHRTR